MRAGIGDLDPNTADWHLAQAGMLLTQLPLLEFGARLGIASKMDFPTVDLRNAVPDERVPENPITGYEQLGTVLTLALSRRGATVSTRPGRQAFMLRRSALLQEFVSFRF